MCRTNGGTSAASGDGAALVIERGFQPQERWRIRMVGCLTAWVIAVVVPGSILANRLAANAAATPITRFAPGTVSLLLLAPVIAYWGTRKPDRSYQVERYLAQRESDVFAILADRRLPDQSIIDRLGRVNPLLWFGTVVGVGVAALAQAPTVALIVVLGGGILMTGTWAAATERTTIETVALANALYTRTDLKTEARVEIGRRSSRVQLDIAGRLRGRQVRLVSDLAMTGGEISASVELAALHTFEFCESDPRWTAWCGADYYDCFEQRFATSGQGLPHSFVSAVARFDRNLRLTSTRDRLRFHCRSGDVRPFYSPGGAVLFLDWLTSLADHLEASGPSSPLGRVPGPPRK